MRALLIIAAAWLLTCGAGPEDGDDSGGLLDVTAQNDGPGNPGSFGGGTGGNGAEGGDTGLPANMRPMTAP